MNVYKVEVSGSYCSGMQIIGAESLEQAIKVAATHVNNTWDLDWTKPDSVERIPGAIWDFPHPDVLAIHEYGE